MQFTSLYPLIQVRNVAATSKFYRDHFGFTPVFESDWYVQLRGPSAAGHELAVIAYDHDSIPPEGREPTRGVILSFEVEDAAADAARLEAAGVRIAQPLRDEVFGQRHMIVADPNGILIDIITPIEPNADWLAAQQG
ncbi:MAG: VOC family protein [Devosia sp.]|uniref:VOC family protein n=1 Tax=unclassified Devosia TaxID=196773 RepID=UPI0019FDF5EC|nr:MULTISPECIES: VOC family protein [unclassified Devosia]MBF0678475.1 VOC family protein [Devosia sp.]WEJ33154.1 VOC family protein [Devosia sp. SD17-2]